MEPTKVFWNYRQQFRNDVSRYEPYERWNCWVNKFETRWRISSKGWDFINSTYHECTNVLGIEVTKEEYKEYLTKDHCPNPYKKWNSGYWSGRWARRMAAREDSTHYVRRDHHEKKELSEHEIHKREWRKKKFKRQDQKRNFRVTPYYKHINKRSHRAFERRCLDTHQTWKLHDRTWFEQDDKWSWD